MLHPDNRTDLGRAELPAAEERLDARILRLQLLAVRHGDVLACAAFVCNAADSTDSLFHNRRPFPSDRPQRLGNKRGVSPFIPFDTAPLQGTRARQFACLLNAVVTVFTHGADS